MEIDPERWDYVSFRAKTTYPNEQLTMWREGANIAPFANAGWYLYDLAIFFGAGCQVAAPG